MSSKRKAQKNKRKKSEPLRLAVLVSGAGTTLQNLIDRTRDGRLPQIEIALVISSRARALANAKAEAAGIPLDVIRVKDSPDVERFSAEIALSLDVYAVDLVVHAGWLCYWRLPDQWLGKAINIHPALLPKFGGKGMYGRHVHEAVIAAGETESGATVHWVNNAYDEGQIIRQERCEVMPNDTPESLAERVQTLERDLLPRVIAHIRDGRVRPPSKGDPRSPKQAR